MNTTEIKPERKMDYELLFIQTLGLLGVINAHYVCLNTIIQNIFNYYSWLMVFFIFMSGMLFAKTGLKRSFGSFFLHKCRTLLLPGLFVNFCYGVISRFMRHYAFVSYGSDISFRTLFITPFLNNDQFGNNLAMWYIFQLFIIEIAANIICRTALHFPNRRFLSDLVILIVSFAVSLYSINIIRSEPYRPEGITLLLRTGFLFFFFAAGIFYERYLRKYLNRLKYPMIGCYLAFFCQVLVMTLTNWPETVIFMPEMNASNIQNNFVPYFTFATAAVFVLCLARWLSPLLEKSKTLRFIGSNTRYVFYHHQFCVIFICLICFVLYLSGHKDLVPQFNPVSFNRHPWYIFRLTENDYAKVPYMIAAFCVPVLIGKLINKIKKGWVRVLVWSSLVFLILVVISFFGRRYQDVIRNIS